MFDPDNWHLFHKLRFLHRFVEQLSTKAKPDWEAVDYVPTQVLTEFFLRVYGQPDEPLDGIVYSSAVTGEPAVVLDVTNLGVSTTTPAGQAPPMPTCSSV